MEYPQSEAGPTSGAGFPVKAFLFWLFFLAFVAGGFYSGVLSLPRVLSWVDAVAAGSLGQRPLPFNLFPSNPDLAPDWNNRERVTILIMGVDRRPDEGRDAPARTDTMMVVTLDPFSRSAGMLSIPRDLWVPIPLKSGSVIQDRVNTANVYGEIYSYPGGGPALAKETVQYNLGVRIHYYVVIDFDGFQRIVDALGGLTMDVPAPLTDYEYPTPDYGTMRIHIPAGMQHFDGERALWYVRSRHQDSDFGRMHRQQQFLMALRERVFQLDALPRLPQLWAEFRDAVRTDLSLTEILTLAGIAREIGSEDILSRSLEFPYVSATITTDGASILLPNRSKMREVMDEVFADVRRVEEAARIEVLNGTTTPGLAARMARQLQSYGLDNVTTGDADGLYKLTEIRNLSGKNYTANLLASLLHVSRDRVKSQAREDGETVDIRLVLGEDAR
ncbi:MAG: LCP family protein [Chloroflexi bacterium]|nr:LCP family protein [Chloroflexota bacterium]